MGLKRMFTIQVKQVMRVFLQFLHALLILNLIAALWVVVYSILQFTASVKEDAVIQIAEYRVQVRELKEALKRQGYALKSHETNDLDYAHKKWRKK